MGIFQIEWLTPGTNEAGSDVSGISTTAITDPDDPSTFLVSGHKKWITTGLFADYATMLVRTSKDIEGMNGLSLLIVPLKTATGGRPSGVTIRAIRVSGLSASGTALISLQGVRVPKKNIIGKEGNGFAMVLGNFNPERLSLAITALTLARSCLADSWEHAMRRRTFGKPLISNQVSSWLSVCPRYV